jgi:hypothetical protein
MKYSKEEIEERLSYLMREVLSSSNQEGGIISLETDLDKMEATVKLNIVIVEEDDYIGFDGY